MKSADSHTSSPGPSDPVPGPGSRPGPGQRVLALLGALALLVLYFDVHLAHLLPGLRERSPHLVGGWLPEEVAWRLGWMALAGLYLVFVCRRVWTPGDSRDENAR